MRIQIQSFDYPQFIFGTDEDGNEFVVHLAVPRFLCKVGVGDEAGPNAASKKQRKEQDKTGPKRHVTREGEILSEFVWLDKEPDQDAFTALMIEAEEFLDIYMAALEDDQD